MFLSQNKEPLPPNPDKLIKKTCSHCGIPFYVDREQSKVRLCSNKCRAARKEISQEKAANKRREMTSTEVQPDLTPADKAIIKAEQEVREHRENEFKSYYVCLDNKITTLTKEIKDYTEKIEKLKEDFNNGRDLRVPS